MIPFEENEIYNLKSTNSSDNESLSLNKDQRNKNTHLSFTKEDIFFYNKIKLTLETYIEPLLFKFQEFKIGFSIVSFKVDKTSKTLVGYLEKLKRDTDFLVEISLKEDSKVYFFICQDTSSEGAIHFSNRMINRLSMMLNSEGEDIKKVLNLKISMVSVEKKTPNIKYIAYEIIKHYIKMKENKKTWYMVKRV